jgi:hypothetical protein
MSNASKIKRTHAAVTANIANAATEHEALTHQISEAQHTAHSLAAYRLYREVALWLIHQPETRVTVHAGRRDGYSEEIKATHAEMCEGARDWWDIAAALAYELKLEHDAQKTACFCPSCTEQQAPELLRRNNA